MPRRDASTGAGLGLAVLSAATFGTSGSFARSLTDAGWSPEAAVAVRVGLAALVLLIPALIALRGKWPAMRRNLPMIGGYGVAAVAGAQVCFFNAVQYLPVGVALLIEYLGIILVVGWMWAARGQRPRALTVAGSVAAVLGLVLVLNVIGGVSLDPVGVLWGLGAAVGLAVYFVVSAGAGQDLPPVAMATGGMLVGALLLAALGLVGVVPMHATFGTVEFAGFTTSWLVPVLGVSLIAAVVAYVAGIGAARMLGPKLSSFVGLTEVLFAVLFAWLLLGELPTVLQFVGGGLIIAGVTLVRVDELRSPSGEPVTSDERELEPVH